MCKEARNKVFLRVPNGKELTGRRKAEMGKTEICEKCNSKGYGRCVCETAPSSCTVDSMFDCSVCAAVRRELNNVAQYLDNAPHAEFERANVEAFVRSLATLMDEAPNA